MKTQMVEIMPGVTIEVSGRLRKRAGLGTLPLTFSKLDDAERKRILGDLVRQNRNNSKYTTLLLDEAVKVSREVGVKEAERITGVRRHSIVGRKRELKKQGRFVSYYKSIEKIKECAAMAESLIGTEFIVQVKRKRTRFSAFIEAGRRMGMNGVSVYQYSYKGKRGLTQHPSTRKSSSRSRAKTASPHAQ